MLLLTYCNRKPRHLAVRNLWSLWRNSFRHAIYGTVPVRERDRRFQCTRPPGPSRVFERKRRLALSGILPNIREVRQRYMSQCPAARGQSTQGVLPKGCLVT